MKEKELRHWTHFIRKGHFVEWAIYPRRIQSVLFCLIVFAWTNDGDTVLYCRGHEEWKRFEQGSISFPFSTKWENDKWIWYCSVRFESETSMISAGQIAQLSKFSETFLIVLQYSHLSLIFYNHLRIRWKDTNPFGMMLMQWNFSTKPYSVQLVG